MATKKPMTKGQFLATIADETELPKKKVAAVFDAMAGLLKKELKGAGLLNIAGLMKVTVIRKPATKAREGINPFTKEKIMIKAKPARNVIKVRPLKTLKDMV
ncbi:MAG: HU family DNA-binding protein [Planctomycetaceae bacterium]|nr:HU family DNA-binding protein [Planctomycetaceae bacterium]